VSREPKAPGVPEGVRRAFRLPWRGRAQTGRDIDDEVGFHLEMRIAELCARGLTPEDARVEALRRFGDTEELRNFCQTIDAPSARRARVRAWLHGWSQDVRFAIRQLRRAPAFTAIAVFTLALGIGANTAIFSVVQHVLLAPFPYRGGNRIVLILESTVDDKLFFAPSVRAIHIWQARTRTLEQIVGYSSDEVTFSDGLNPELLTSANIADDMLPFLGVRPLLGRNFTPRDTVAGAAPVVLLGYGIWQRRYGGSAGVLGRLVRLNGKPFVVIGVMPRDLSLPFDPRARGVWMPLHATAPNEHVGTMGRLRQGRTVHDASRELTAITATARADGDNSKLVGSAVARTRRDLIGDDYRRTLIMLFGAVGLVLLIACANVANLLLVRAGGRQREFAVRTALGAGRGRLIRQVLTESMLLALAGCAVGLLLAWRVLQVIIALSPADLDLAGVHLEPAVLAWSVGISVITGLIFGLAPALFATEHTIGESLKAAVRSASASVRTRRVRAALVIGEIALSVVLLVGAGLLMRSFAALEHVDPGFDPHGLVGVSIQMPAEQFPSPLSRQAAITQVRDAVKHIPGVQAVTISVDMPPNGSIAFGDLEIEGRTLAASDGVSLLGYEMGDTNYFRVVGIPLREGRVFAPDKSLAPASDSAAHAGPDEIVIGQRFAKRFWPSGSALGARIRLNSAADWNTIVGVVGDVQRPGELGAVSKLRMYAPFSANMPPAELLVRTTASSHSLVPMIMAAITHADPFVEVYKVQSGESVIAEAVAQPRFAMTLVGTFALLALVLAVVGLYGVIAYSVSQRTREIGVRIALGARPRDVVTLVVRQGFILVLIGIVIGVAAAVGVTRAIRSLLFGVTSTDTLTFVVAGTLIALVAALACYIPARRAALIDPVVALRAD
jgi:putative ABC transport system permease protein